MWGWNLFLVIFDEYWFVNGLKYFCRDDLSYGQVFCLGHHHESCVGWWLIVKVRWWGLLILWPAWWFKFKFLLFMGYEGGVLVDDIDQHSAGWRQQWEHRYEWLSTHVLLCTLLDGEWKLKNLKLGIGEWLMLKVCEITFPHNACFGSFSFSLWGLSVLMLPIAPASTHRGLGYHWPHLTAVS